MKILTVHNRYQQRGGEDESRESEDRLMRSKGHEVFEYVDDNRRIAELGPLHAGLRTTWSSETYRAVTALIQQNRPDVMDVHNFFPLISPSVYYAARAQRVPVVQTLHNYRLICPSATFFRNGRICEDCLGKPVPWPGVLHSCYRGDRAATVAVASMISIHRLLHTWDNLVDVYVTLSEFSRQKLVEAGLPQERMMVKPNFVEPDPGVRTGEGDYALFVGRLSPEKGVQTLLTAWRDLRHVPLQIVGAGPLLDHVRAAIQRDGLAQVSLREWVDHPEVMELLRGARFLVFPSVWYEAFPRTPVEAFACGVPVVGSCLGTLPEVVEDGRLGVLFNPGDPADLATKVAWAWAHPEEMAAMGRTAREEYEARYTAERNYRRMMEIFNAAIERARGRR